MSSIKQQLLEALVVEKTDAKFADLTTAELRSQAEDAIRKGDRARIAALTTEIRARLAKKGIEHTGLTKDPAKLADLKRQRDAILKK